MWMQEQLGGRLQLAEGEPGLGGGEKHAPDDLRDGEMVCLKLSDVQQGCGQKDD